MNQPILLYKKFTGIAGLLFLSKALSMVANIIYARFLGPQEYGLYSYALAIIAMATVPTVAGLPNFLVREIANYQVSKEEEYLTGIIKWSRNYVLVISVVVVVFMYAALYCSLFDDKISSLLWCAILLIPIKGMLTQQGAVLNGFRKPILAQLPVQIFASAFTLAAVLVFILIDLEFTSSSLIDLSIISSLLGLLIGFVLIKKLIVLKKIAKYDKKRWHYSLVPFSFMYFIGALNAELASVLLGFLEKSESVAYFKVAMQAGTLIALGLTAIDALIMPNVASLYKSENFKDTQDLISKSVRLVSIISLPLIFLLVFFGDLIIIFLFGSEYVSAYPILVVLCFGQLVNVIMGSVGLVLNMTGNENKALKSLSLTLVLNVMLLGYLVPNYGAMGAAVSVSCSLICWNILMGIEVWRSTGLKTWLRF
ncbi:flippase [Gammaproteobacteria bacterium LSUCC0057]|uniref:Flippase n=1 Tax=Gammaproteobacteria bacterium LSUCC0057 TaxID=2559237 RepID=A0A4Y8UJS8_9GAMM|nr:flippase [Gammaproteobacteria bacterium LSUCC0057]